MYWRNQKFVVVKDGGSLLRLGGATAPAARPNPIQAPPLTPERDKKTSRAQLQPNFLHTR